MKLKVERGAKQEYVDIETGERFFSVSQIRHVLLDPYDGIPLATLEAAQQRGVRLHRRFFFLLASRIGCCDRPAQIEGLEGYCTAMDDWAEKHDVEAVKLEESSACPKLGYAGTPDALVRYGPKRLLAIVDGKSGAPVPTEAAQLRLYKGMDGYREASVLIDLYIREDGTYKEVRRESCQRDWAAALAALSILRWRMTHGC